MHSATKERLHLACTILSLLLVEVSSWSSILEVIQRTKDCWPLWNLLRPSRIGKENRRPMQVSLGVQSRAYQCEPPTQDFDAAMLGHKLSAVLDEILVFVG
jgi:hypothetical protein